MRPLFDAWREAARPAIASKGLSLAEKHEAAS
jgi:hypothetical protein